MVSHYSYHAAKQKRQLLHFNVEDFHGVVQDWNQYLCLQVPFYQIGMEVEI